MNAEKYIMDKLPAQQAEPAESAQPSASAAPPLDMTAIVSDPAKFVGTAVSAQIKSKIDTDDGVKAKLAKTAEHVVDNTVEQLRDRSSTDTQNTYYDRRREALLSMGIGGKTDKWKMRMVSAFYDVWFALFYVTVGFWFLAPLVVLLNIAKSISNKTTKETSSRYGALATCVAVIIFVAYCVGWGFGIYFLVTFFRR